MRVSLGRIFSAGLFVSGVTVIVAIVRSKVVAVVLGPAGLGVTVEVATVVSAALMPAMIVGGPSLVRALGRGLAPDADADARASAQGAYDTAWTATFVLGAVGIAVAAAVGPWLYGWDAGMEGWVVAMGICLATVHASSTVTGRVLSAAGRLQAHSVGAAATTAIQVLTVALGTWAYGLPGFFLGNVAGALVAAAIWQIIAVRASVPLRTAPRPLLDRWHLREAARLGAASLAGTGTTHVTLLILRTAIARSEGTEGNGLFAACWSFDAQIVTAVLGTLGSFVFPRYAAAKDRRELQAELGAVAGFVLRVAPPVLLVAIALRGPVLVALYSAEFRPAAALLGWMLAGDVAKLMSWTQGGVLLYRGHARIFAILQLVSGCLFIALALAGLWGYGLVGIGYGYFVAHMLSVALTGAAVRSAEGIAPQGSTVALAWGASLLALACNAAVGAFWWGPAIPLLAAAVWAIAAGAPRAVVDLWRSRRRR